MDKEMPQVPKGPFRFLLITSKPHWRAAFWAILFVVIASVSEAFIPYIFKRVVDAVHILSTDGSRELWFWAGMYIVLGFIGAMMWRASGFVGMHWVTGTRATGRNILSEYVTKHSYGFFSNHFAGAVGSKLSNASEGVKNMAESFLWGWIGLFLSIVISLGLVFYTNVYIGLIFLAWIIFITPLNLKLIRKRIPLGIVAQERETELRAQTVDVLTNVSAMHDYSRRPFELDTLRDLIDIRRYAGLRNWKFGEIILTVNSVLETIFVGAMILGTVYLFDIGIITAGDIILVLTLVLSISGELQFLGRRFNNTAETISEVREGLEEILKEHEIVDSPFATELNVSQGEITFENVSFTYSSQEIFSKLNLHIKPGERVGVVGHSGAGKSTLMKIIIRQYDLTGGKILIDGQNIALVTQESLRDSIAIVPQDPLLFHRTLKANIRYGKLDATDDEVIAAAKHAQAHDFINTLPLKYDTFVGERGIKLSGGERQRVAIARAFLKDTKILLLDEATSSLDSESETAIQSSLSELMRGKTVIAIAHRLSTLRAMDRIIVIEKGTIVEDGTHDRLLQQKGVYAKLWTHQAGGFLQDE